MDIMKPIEDAYPKVKHLMVALIAAASEQGASAEEFEMACAWIEQMIQKRASGILLSELQRGG